MLSVLEAFRERLNAHPDRGQLLKRWTPEIEICVSGTDDTYLLTFSDERLNPILREGSGKAHVIRIEADASILAAVFSGGLSPAQAYFDGSLFVVADDADQVRLDTIAYALWEGGS